MRIEPAKTVAPVETVPKTAGEKQELGAFAELVGVLLNMMAPPPAPMDTSEEQVSNIAPTSASSPPPDNPDILTVEHLLLSLPTEFGEPELGSLTTSEQAPELVVNTPPDESLSPKPKAPPIEQEKVQPPIQTNQQTESKVPENAEAPEHHLDASHTAPNITSKPVVIPQKAQEQNIPVERVQPGTEIKPDHINLANPIYSGADRLPPVTASSLQALRTEIIAFSNNPSKPTVVLEVSPPDYGKVVVSAERDTTGHVSIRLVVENIAVKAAVIEQVPSLSSSTSIVVVTAEENQEWREQGQKRQPQEEKRRPKKDQETQVEFVI